MSLTEYKTGSTFPGRMGRMGRTGRTVGESEPAWPAPLRSKPGAPNVLYIVLDDTDYGQFGCYGSPINTPNLDRLAENGLRYTNMHTTALCAPSRSCMLTGRNHPQTRCPASPVGAQELSVSSSEPLIPGKHLLRYEFEPTGPPDLKAGKGTPGIARLFVDGQPVGQAEFPLTVPLALGIGSGLTIGRNSGSAVSRTYTTPFAFTGTITKAVIDVSGKPDLDDDDVKEGQARVAMARQ